MAGSRCRAVVFLLSATLSASALADRQIPIVSESRAGESWPAAGAIPDALRPPGDGRDACVSIGYYIGPDGVASQFAHLKSWSDAKPEAGGEQRLEAFEQSAVATLENLRFVPADANKPKPMYTSATFVFPAAAGSDVERLRKRCAISNLRAFIADAQMRADPITWYQIKWNGEWFHAKTRVHGLNRE